MFGIFIGNMVQYIPSCHFPWYMIKAMERDATNTYAKWCPHIRPMLPCIVWRNYVLMSDLILNQSPEIDVFTSGACRQLYLYINTLRTWMGMTTRKSYHGWRKTTTRDEQWCTTWTEKRGKWKKRVKMKRKSYCCNVIVFVCIFEEIMINQ